MFPQKTSQTWAERCPVNIEGGLNRGDGFELRDEGMGTGCDDERML